MAEESAGIEGTEGAGMDNAAAEGAAAASERHEEEAEADAEAEAEEEEEEGDDLWIFRDGEVNREWVDGSDLDEDEEDEEEDEEYREYYHAYLEQLRDSDATETLKDRKASVARGLQIQEDGTSQSVKSSASKVQGAGVDDEADAGEDEDEEEEDDEDDMLVAPRYYDWREYFPQVQGLLDHFDELVEEMETLTSGRWCPWPEYKLYQAEDQFGDWKVIPLLHTFPAWDPSRTKYIEGNCQACPRTMELLKNIPGLRTVLYSRLGPRTRLSSHQGWADLANYVLRCHLPLVLPKGDHLRNSCGMWVEGDIRSHTERDVLVFDDSKMHKAFNASDEERIILIFDLVRPDSLPKGLASGGHTEQLDEFIAQYEASLGLFPDPVPAQTQTRERKNHQ